MPHISEVNGATGFAGVYQHRPDQWQALRFQLGLLWDRGVLDRVVLDLIRLKSANLIGCRH